MRYECLGISSVEEGEGSQSWPILKYSLRISSGETERNQFPKPKKSVIPSRSNLLHPDWDDDDNYNEW
jgi:hypothetical protein